eukprot:9100314-Pyramimonas_sp.AAC.3
MAYAVLHGPALRSMVPVLPSYLTDCTNSELPSAWPGWDKKELQRRELAQAGCGGQHGRGPSEQRVERLRGGSIVKQNRRTHLHLHCRSMTLHHPFKGAFTRQWFEARAMMALMHACLACFLHQFWGQNRLTCHIVGRALNRFVCGRQSLAIVQIVSIT